MYTRHLCHFLVILGFLLGTPTPVLSQDLDADIRGAIESLGASFPAGDVAGFTALLAEPGLGVQGDTLGHMLYARRQFDKAAWFFGTDALGDLTDPASLNNFAAMMVETYADDPDTYPIDWLNAAYHASQRALELAPDDAVYHNNLGHVARRLGFHDEAITNSRRATELDPNEPLYWTNFARALHATGDTEGAAEALARAHSLNPSDASLIFATQSMPDAMSHFREAIAPSCNVNFRCQEICPKSIIGGLMSVTCEMENSSAQLACMEGSPYPTSFNCKEDLPEYGILIPGLNSGFSIAVPGFSVHVLVDGEGNVDVRVEAGVSMGPVTGYVGTDGHFSPDGGVSFDNNRGGVRLSLFNKGPGAETANALGHPPVHIEAESINGQPVDINVETYNAGVISY